MKLHRYINIQIDKAENIVLKAHDKDNKLYNKYTKTVDFLSIILST